MTHATASLRPWFTHPRMVPKWLGFLTAAAVAVVSPASGAWLAVALGVAVWFPTEYVVHRFVYHTFAHRPLGAWLSRNHVAHHGEPEEMDKLFNDPRFGLGLALTYFVVALAVTRSIGVAAAFSAGNLAALVYYEYVHFTAHRPGVVPRTKWGQYLKRWHLWHHYKNEHYWFGVTHTTLDKVLRTDPQQGAVPKSDTVRTLAPPREDRALFDE